jgi:hypothetical protein
MLKLHEKSKLARDPVGKEAWEGRKGEAEGDLKTSEKPE